MSERHTAQELLRRRHHALGRAWADPPLPARGLVVVAIALLALVVTAVLQVRGLTPAAIGLGMLLGLAGGVATMPLFSAGVTRREATLQALISASPDIIAILGPDGRVRFLSHAMQRVTGRSPDDRVGRNAFDSALIHPHDRDGFARAQQRVLSGESGEAVARIRVRHSNGRWVVLEAHTCRLGADEGAVVVARDITGQAALEEDLRHAKLAAEQANKAKNEYLSRMSHELRTPLNAILGFAQLLELDQLNGEQRDNLRYILAGARQLLGLINEVLDIAAVEAGRLPLSLEPVAVAAVAAEAIGLIRPLAHQHAVLLLNASPTHDDHRHHVLGDRERLKQVLLNLLSNAVSYNREGGSVHLACEQVAGERLRITVADTGPGIAPELLELLFVPFERLRSEQTSVEGSGLGLSLSKRLAEAMGGALGVSTAVGRGSTFWVELPLVESPVEQAERQQLEPSWEEDELRPAGPALTVLCIEDNLSNLQLIERVLDRRPSVKLVSAMRPQLGLDLAGEYRPDLVLLDLHLPDMPGTEVLRRLRADPKTSSVPVVILTADARPGLVTRLLDQGARAFLTKPLNVRELLRLLDAIAAERAG